MERKHTMGSSLEYSHFSRQEYRCVQKTTIGTPYWLLQYGFLCSFISSLPILSSYLKKSVSQYKHVAGLFWSTSSGGREIKTQVYENTSSPLVVAQALNFYALCSIICSFNFYFYIPVRYFMLNNDKYPCRIYLDGRFWCLYWPLWNQGHFYHFFVWGCHMQNNLFLIRDKCL